VGAVKEGWIMTGFAVTIIIELVANSHHRDIKSRETILLSQLYLVPGSGV
jgi:hypothetical protein